MWTMKSYEMHLQILGFLMDRKKKNQSCFRSVLNTNTSDVHFFVVIYKPPKYVPNSQIFLSTDFGNNLRGIHIKGIVYTIKLFPYMIISCSTLLIDNQLGKKSLTPEVSWLQSFDQLPLHTVQSPNDFQAKSTAANRKFRGKKKKKRGHSPPQPQLG